jgi:hypothetical protein
MRRALLLMLLLAGCRPALTPETFCEEYARAHCESTKKCCTEVTLLPGQCENSYRGICETSLSLAAAGRNSFDTSAATSCINEMLAKDSACPGLVDGESSPFRIYESCKAVSAGTRQAGELCGGKEGGCAPGLFCDPAGNGEARCEKLNIICEASCAAGTYCAAQSRECEPRPRAGERCEDFDACEVDHFCNDAEVCEHQRPVDGTCEGDYQCTSNRCNDGAARCVAPRNPYCAPFTDQPRG